MNKTFLTTILFVLSFTIIYGQKLEPINDKNKIDNLISILKNEDPFAKKMFTNGQVFKTFAFSFTNPESGIYNEPSLFIKLKTSTNSVLFYCINFLKSSGEYFPSDDRVLLFTKQSAKFIEKEFTCNHQEMASYMSIPYPYYKIELGKLEQGYEFYSCYGLDLAQKVEQEFDFKNNKVNLLPKEKLPAYFVTLFNSIK